MSYKITDEEINKVKLNSPFALPDSPTERGMKPGAIKEMFWKPFLELMSLINRKLGELDNSRAGDLSAHNVNIEAHRYLRQEIGAAMKKAEDAYGLASGKRAVHYEQTMQFALKILKMTKLLSYAETIWNY